MKDGKWENKKKFCFNDVERFNFEIMSRFARRY